MNHKRIAFIVYFFTACHFANAANEPFITIWQTPNMGIRIDAIGEFTYTWKDLNNLSHTGNGSGGSTSASVSATNISFGAAGKYQLEITPVAGAHPFSHIEMNTGYPDAHYLTQITQWGDIAWSSMAYAFMDAQNLTITAANDVPRLGAVTNMAYMFNACESLTTIPNIGNWDVSHVTDMSYMFGGCSVLTNIPGIGNWNVGSVKDLGGMFAVAYLFNEDISGWDVGLVENMSHMFEFASGFNQPIGKWKGKTGKVQNTWAMFSGAAAFNQDLNEWDMSRVTDMQQMFLEATAFNGTISNWNVSKVEYMSLMFAGAASFNGDISGWGVGSVVDMSEMFSGAIAFNANIGGWDVSKVANTSYMFYKAAAFNQNLGEWKLNALKVSIFSSSAEGMLSYSGLDCSNYSKALIGWAKNSADLLRNIKLGADGLSYGTEGKAARIVLTATNKWTITGDNYDEQCSITVLPVNFGAVSAIFKNNRLYIHWVTLSETNSSYFDIEVSRDGKTFTKLETVSSKAVNGMSQNHLNYEYTAMMPQAATVIGLMAFGLLLSVSGRKRKRVYVAILVLVSGFTALSSCQKNGDELDAAGQGGQLFIRIKQVDKDGDFQYSKVIKTIVE
ncbi:BspA family leucine-rich repeat surface protein [Niabella drilacis]|uniref:Surface protein n=1 Tax=Niabella drilacis (strain DSM 25811 / CCM 8410 / CCUG 62505 / LMG 26954 / E90) TaxID=1285928 RepID=A0A1G6NF88_NIADE|nr:BspA family leucine-rich repeat surface protein [Niabella drilacis]SDC66530.1 surface protein [Niabella drilacis]